MKANPSKPREKKWPVRIAAGCLVFAVVLSAAYYYWVQSNDNFHAVIDGRIYRSAQISGERLQALIRDKDLKAVINLRGPQEDEQWFRTEKQVAAKNGAEYTTVKLRSHELPNCIELDKLVRALETAPRPLLLHCKAGADRSGLASALALSMEQDPPISDVKRQFSLFYGVIPHTDSIGPLFFERYESWLARSGRRHSWNTLSQWIRTDYVDAKGNIEFAVDGANGRWFAEDRENVKKTVTLKAPQKTVTIWGWAFDLRQKRPVQHLFVIVSGSRPWKAAFVTRRPDVAEALRLEKEAFPECKFGWVAHLDGSALPHGCHDIFLKVDLEGGKSHRVATNRQLCLERQ